MPRLASRDCEHGREDMAEHIEGCGLPLSLFSCTLGRAVRISRGGEGIGLGILFLRAASSVERGKAHGGAREWKRREESR